MSRLSDIFTSENIQKFANVLGVLSGGPEGGGAVAYPGYYDYQPTGTWGGGGGGGGYMPASYDPMMATPASAAAAGPLLARAMQLFAAGYTIEQVAEALGIGGEGLVNVAGLLGGGGGGACPTRGVAVANASNVFKESCASVRPVQTIESDDPKTGKRHYWTHRGTAVEFSKDKSMATRYAKRNGLKLVRRGG